MSVRFGPSAAEVVDVALPVLAGAKQEELLALPAKSERAPASRLVRNGSWRCGLMQALPGEPLAEASQRIYAEIFRATRGLHLARLWNYVPAINATGPEGLENYRIFSRERSLAFEAEFGPGFQRHLPAASAVGCGCEGLKVFFLASPFAARHVENPRQVPAYEYPAEYGPRPPSFARATVVDNPEGPTVFVSGTAAVCGHATVAPNDTRAQLGQTLENLREISRACGLGERLGREALAARSFKIYLRRADDLALVRQTLERELLRENDWVSYVQSDICRRPLMVEIEAQVGRT